MSYSEREINKLIDSAFGRERNVLANGASDAPKDIDSKFEYSGMYSKEEMVDPVGKEWEWKILFPDIDSLKTIERELIVDRELSYSGNSEITIPLAKNRGKCAIKINGTERVIQKLLITPRGGMSIFFYSKIGEEDKTGKDILQSISLSLSEFRNKFYLTYWKDNKPVFREKITKDIFHKLNMKYVEVDEEGNSLVSLFLAKSKIGKKLIKRFTKITEKKAESLRNLY